MSVTHWRRIAWIYHIAFGFAVIWPGQALVNTPVPLILGLPRQIVWLSGWIIGSLLVLWRLDRAEAPFRDGGPADGRGGGSANG